ncbi:MAG: hypothetical protein NXI10_09405 [bacterium]|nr:hypothetical protein [bacterium]
METAAIATTLLSTLCLALSLLLWLILMITLIFWLSKHNQEGGLMGGNFWRKVFKKSQAHAETLEEGKEKKSIQARLKFIKTTQWIILGSLVGVIVAIVLWQFVP